jgi:caa(3)-type oxidase subunit IV
MSDSHAHEDHSKQYYRVLAYLTVLTLVEVGVALMMEGDDATIGFGLGVVLLVAMAFVKATLVGRYYMHLAFDPRLLAFLAMSPLIFATIIILVGISDNVTWPSIPS